MDEYINLLKTHDWYYNYSDDHRVWRAGEEEYKKIMELSKLYDPTREIFRQYMTLCMVLESKSFTPEEI